MDNLSGNRLSRPVLVGIRRETAFQPRVRTIYNRLRASPASARSSDPENGEIVKQLSPKSMEKLLWSLARGLALSDHMGDAWGSFELFWKLLEMEPLEFSEEHGMPNLDFIEQHGGVSLYTLEREGLE